MDTIKHYRNHTKILIAHLQDITMYYQLKIIKNAFLKIIFQSLKTIITDIGKSIQNKANPQFINH